MKLFKIIEREIAKRRYNIDDDVVDEFLVEFKKINSMSDEERAEYLADYEDDDDELYYYDYDEVPPGCRACGGPYPQCETSCKLFDD